MEVFIVRVTITALIGKSGIQYSPFPSIKFGAQTIVKEDINELREMQVTVIGFCNVFSSILLFLGFFDGSGVRADSRIVQFEYYPCGL